MVLDSRFFMQHYQTNSNVQRLAPTSPDIRSIALQDYEEQLQQVSYQYVRVNRVHCNSHALHANTCRVISSLLRAYTCMHVKLHSITYCSSLTES